MPPKIFDGRAPKKKDRQTRDRERERKSKREKEKTRTSLGKDVRVRTVGGDPCTRAPPPKKGPLAQQRLRVPATQTKTLEPKTTFPVKEGTNPPRSRRSPGSHSSQGRARSPVPEPRDHGPGLLVKTCGAARSTNGEKQKQRKKTQKRLCRLASEKRASEEASKLKPHDVPRESRKRAGPQNAPRENARREGTHGQNGR